MSKEIGGLSRRELLGRAGAGAPRHGCASGARRAPRPAADHAGAVTPAGTAAGVASAATRRTV